MEVSLFRKGTKSHRSVDDTWVLALNKGDFVHWSKSNLTFCYIPTKLRIRFHLESLISNLSSWKFQLWPIKCDR